MGSSDDVERLEQEKRKLEENIVRAREKQKAAALQKAQLAEKRKKEGSDPSQVDFHIRFTPRKILTGVVIILVILAVFVLGRISADDSASEGSEGFFSKFFSGKSAGEATKKPVAVEVSPPEDTTVADTTEPVPTEETPPEPEPVPETPPTDETEKVLTTYKAVTLTLNDVTIDWKTTWGKITHIDYTIKNSEAGTIKTGYFIMTMEGYDDFEKKIPSALSISAGQSDSAVVTVPSGFAYNEASTGDLTNVKITLTLYDAADKQIATFQKEFDLKGA